MIIDEVEMEEQDMQDDYNEEEEDLNNIPLFANFEETVEPSSLVESSVTLPGVMRLHRLSPLYCYTLI